MNPGHIYKALQEAMDAKIFNEFNFAEAFETWEHQSGYPIIHVTHNKILGQFQVTQKRYLNANSNNINSSSWFVPLNFAHANNPDFEDTTITHFHENGTSLKLIPTGSIQGFDDNDWFVFNKQQLNYYRVNYDLENWRNIMRVLNSADYQQIHVLNRAQLIDDAFNLAFDGYVDFDVLLGILAYLQHETDYLPWGSAANYLDRLDYLLSGANETQALFHEFISHLVSRMFAKLGMQQNNGEHFMTKYAREFAINWSCRTGNAKCLDATFAEIRLTMTEGKVIPKPLDVAFLCGAMRTTNCSEEFVHFWRVLRESTDQADRLRIIDGLACSSNPVIIKSFLESSTAYNSDVDYRSHERTRIFHSVLASSSIGISCILDFLSHDLNEILFA